MRPCQGFGCHLNLNGRNIFHYKFFTEWFQIVGIDLTFDHVVVVQPDSVVFHDHFAQLTNGEIWIFLLLLCDLVLVANQI